MFLNTKNNRSILRSHKNQFISFGHFVIFRSPSGWRMVIWWCMVFSRWFCVWIIVSSRALGTSWRFFLVANHLDAFFIFKTILGHLTTLFTLMSSGSSSWDLFDLVPWVLHELHNLLKLFLTFFCGRIDFDDLRLFSLFILTAFGSRRLMGLLGRVHHFLHHFLHGISMIWVPSCLGGRRFCVVTRSVGLLLFHWRLLVRSINLSFLALAVFTPHLFAVAVMALNFIARFFLEGMHFTIIAHLGAARALERLLLDFSISRVHGWHLSNMLESVSHLLLFILHAGLHLMHRVLNRIFNRASNIRHAEAWT